MDKVAFLIMTWNKLGPAAKAFRSLYHTLHSDQYDVHWHILDNGSEDGTAHWLTKIKCNKKINVRLSTTNRGVAGGRQFLMDWVRPLGYDYLVFLDEDVYIHAEEWLHDLLEPIQVFGAGLAGPGGHFIDPTWQFYEAADDDYYGPVDTVSGFCQAFPAELLELGISLDQRYNPYWHEDTDMCLQIKSLGFDVVCVGDIGVEHLYAGSGDDGTGGIKQEYLANKFRGQGLIRAEQ